MNQVMCPLCGSPQRITRAGAYSRLFCKKCHTPFHLDRAGTPVVGEPPAVGEREVEELKQALWRALDQIPIRRIVTGLAAFLVVAVAFYLLLRPAERLDRAAERAARAFAEGDLAYLQSIAASGTEEDVARWYAEAHARLVQDRARWHGREEVIDVQAQEDQARRGGSAGISIRPGIMTGRDVSLADPSVATASAAGSFDLQTDWTRSRWGGWRLDGRATVTKSLPTP
jgi:hypothetical protein